MIDGEAGQDLWQVYLLQCADGTYYCGVARDAQKRLLQHNGQLPGGARYTASRRPVALLAKVELAGRGNALRFEAVVKRQPRRKKIAMLLGGLQCQDWS